MTMIYLPRPYAGTFRVAFVPPARRMSVSFGYADNPIFRATVDSRWVDGYDPDNRHRLVQELRIEYTSRALFDEFGLPARFGIGEHGCPEGSTSDAQRVYYHSIGDATDNERRESGFGIR